MLIHSITVPYESTDKILHILSFFEKCSFTVETGKSKSSCGNFEGFRPTVIKFNNDIFYSEYLTIKDEIARLVREGTIERASMKIVDCAEIHFNDCGVAEERVFYRECSET